MNPRAITPVLLIVAGCGSTYCCREGRSYSCQTVQAAASCETWNGGIFAELAHEDPPQCTRASGLDSTDGGDFCQPDPPPEILPSPIYFTPI